MNREAIGLNLRTDILDNIFDGVYILSKEGRITYWNKAAEALVGYRGNEVLDKVCKSSLVLHMDDAGSKLSLTDFCPYEKSMKDDKVIKGEYYILHKDGYRVKISSRVVPIKNISGGAIGVAHIFNDSSAGAALKIRVERLRKLALLDPLTELGNEKYADISLQSRIHENKRYGWRFGILYIDIDSLKNVNDKYDDETGDRVLKMAGNTFLRSTRMFDAFSRKGGDKFIGVIANVNKENLFLTAERLRQLIEQSSFLLKKREVGVTVSICARMGSSGDTPENLIEDCVKLMRKSKAAGINRVSMG